MGFAGFAWSIGFTGLRRVKGFGARVKGFRVFFGAFLFKGS